MYGIPDYKLSKLDKEQFKKDWQRSILAKTDAMKRAVDVEFDYYAVPAMLAREAQINPISFGGGIGFGMPCPGCTFGGGFGFFG